MDIDLSTVEYTPRDQLDAAKALFDIVNTKYPRIASILNVRCGARLYTYIMRNSDQLRPASTGNDRHHPVLPRSGEILHY